MKNKNCNLSTCRYNADGKCTNEEKREECVRVSKAVLLIDDLADIEVPDNQCAEKKNPFNICRTNPDCELDPEHCGFSVDCTVNGDLPNRIYMCGRDKCIYSKGWKQIDGVVEYGENTEKIDVGEI